MTRGSMLALLLSAPLLLAGCGISFDDDDDDDRSRRVGRGGVDPLGEEDIDDYDTDGDGRLSNDELKRAGIKRR